MSIDLRVNFRIRGDPRGQGWEQNPPIAEIRSGDGEYIRTSGNVSPPPPYLIDTPSQTFISLCKKIKNISILDFFF